MTQPSLLRSSLPLSGTFCKTSFIHLVKQPSQRLEPLALFLTAPLVDLQISHLVGILLWTSCLQPIRMKSSTNGTFFQLGFMESFSTLFFIQCAKFHGLFTKYTVRVIFGHSPHRISAGGSLLFMRFVSLTSTGLISAWRRGEASSAILAKSLSDCVNVLCPGQC